MMVRDHVKDPSARCKFCGRAIFWAVSTRGKPMPIEPAAEPGPAGNLILQENLTGEHVAAVVGAGEGTHRHHKTTCPTYTGATA